MYLCPNPMERPQFSRYRYARVPFATVPVEDMFKCKVDKIFKNQPNGFDIADDILIVGYTEMTMTII